MTLISAEPEDINILIRWSMDKSRPRLAKRASIVLLLCCAEEYSIRHVATKMQTSMTTIARCRQRFLDEGLEGISYDTPRVGRVRKETTPSIEDIREVILYRKRKNGMRWTYTSLAEELKTSSTTLKRICKNNNIPISGFDIRMSEFLLYDYPIRDIAGVYIDSLIQAIAFYCEKHDRYIFSTDVKSIPSPRGSISSETYSRKCKEFFNILDLSIRNLEHNEISNSIPDFLRFLHRIRLQKNNNKTLLIMSSFAIDKGDKIARFLGQHSEIRVVSWATIEVWREYIFGLLEDIDDFHRRTIFLKIDHITRESLQFIQESKMSHRPFVSIPCKKSKYS